MATTSHHSGRAYLCRPIETNGWEDQGRKIGDVYYGFRVSIGKGRGQDIPLQNIYTIAIEGTTSGLGAGERAPPVIYDPNEAELEVKGKKIKALRRLWRSDDSGDTSPPPEVSIPANLNVLGKVLSSTFYIAFPIKIDDPKTQFVFRPGTILLDGTRYPLPVYKSCYESGGFRWYPIT